MGGTLPGFYKNTAVEGIHVLARRSVAPVQLHAEEGSVGEAQGEVDDAARRNPRRGGGWARHSGAGNVVGE